MQIISVVFLFFMGITSWAAAPEEPDYYTHKIQPIFDARCLSCHSCFNAPCQLNLQNFENFSRGANKLNVYDGLRLQSVQPSRPGIDAQSAKEWQEKKSFFSVNTSPDPEKNLFLQAILMKNGHENLPPKKIVEESRFCPASEHEQAVLKAEQPALGMPYGFPALTLQEQGILTEWVKMGAPGPNRAAQKKIDFVPKKIAQQVRDWERFFNNKDLKSALVSRYLYEHLFLAHLYFPEESEIFFRLVRSKTACGDGLQEIPTRRPNDDPGSKFFYCFKKFTATPVMKTHLPYELSERKMETLKKIFYAEPWSVTKVPSYAQSVAENPFVAFQDIPAKARYKYLLLDARYQVATFIKGPVCNGSNAVNSIQEQFFVFFLNPDSDQMLLNKEYENQAKKLLILPGVWGSDVPLQETPILGKELLGHREKYRALRAERLKEVRPAGYELADVWNGDGWNENAVLTVFRHDDNAVVMTGAAGDLPKTLFMLDYPLMERLVYNLVVNFDVFGNVGHQMLTRSYMDMIRMEAEEMALAFLPPEQRLLLRQSWYRGLLTGLKMSYIFPTVASDIPTSIKYKKDANSKMEFVSKVLFYRLNEKTRGQVDGINWKNLELSSEVQMQMKTDSVEAHLRKISAIQASGKTPFAKYFPEMSYLMVEGEKGERRVFSLIMNREHENISWILGESLRLALSESTLTVKEGFWGSYPQQFFVVSEKALPAFVQATVGVKSEKDFKKLLGQYGVHRQSEGFWRVYDTLNEFYRLTEPSHFGYLDLTRYSL